MKIQKAIFSCSEPPAYSSYWNMQSRLCRVGLGIEPVCLLWGKRANTDMTEEYGKVIEMEPMPHLPPIIQMTWSKFDYPRTEPETIWMIGDMDLLPLRRRYFVEDLVNISDEWYLHLNRDGISNPRIGLNDGFRIRGSERHGKDNGFIGADLPAHYHVAKGKHFERLYYPGLSFQKTVEHIVYSDRFGLGPMNDYPKEKKTTDPYWYYWCAEEHYPSYCLWSAIREGRITFKGIPYHNELQRVFKWNKDAQDYEYSTDKAMSQHYVDIHCNAVRPYGLQATALERLIGFTGLLK